MNFTSLIVEYIQQGGFVSVALVVLFLIMSYCIGYRFFLLFPGRKEDMRVLYKKGGNIQSVQAQFLMELKDLEGEKALEGRIDWLMKGAMQEIHSFSAAVNTTVVLAPLLGLLGTVIGMIETFSSLTGSALFSSSGGIAGGISQALITTQLGLVVAIPGVFISRYLKKVEFKTYQDILQLKELFLQTKKDLA